MSSQVDDVHETAAKLIEQAPPGQVREVIEDLQIITSDPEHFMPLALKHLAVYNLAQFQVIPAPDGSGRKTILSQASLIPSSTSSSSTPESNPLCQSQDHSNGDPARYVDPVGKISFKVDHAGLGTTDSRPHVIPEEHEIFRSALATSLNAYLSAHFSSSDSACAVFCSSSPAVPAAEVKVQAEQAGGDAVIAEGGNLREGEAGAVEEQDGETSDKVVGSSVESAQKVDGTDDIAEPSATAGQETTTSTTTDDDTAATSAAEGIVAAVTETITDVKDAILGETTTAGSTNPEASAPILPVKPEEPEEQDVSKSVPTGPNEVAGSEEKVDTVGDGPSDSNDSVSNETGELESSMEVTSSVPAKSQETVQENVEPVVERDPVYTLQIVGNKYNQSNFWTGRWRSEYVVDPTPSTVTGSIKVDVHYFEQGNVQLATSHSPQFPYPAAASTPREAASEIVTIISRIEQAYQSKLNETYSDLGEKAFRSLRRALPITRQKVDWDKIGLHKIGGQINK